MARGFVVDRSFFFSSTRITSLFVFVFFGGVPFYSDPYITLIVFFWWGGWGGGLNNFK